MEKFEGSMYRKGLAHSLSEMRGSGQEGKEEAKELLKKAKDASLYHQAKQLKQEKEVSQENTQELSFEQIEKKVVAELLALVETNPYVTFSMSVYGTFSLSPFYKGSVHDGSSGSSTYVFNAETQQFANVGLGHRFDPLKHRSEVLRGWGNLYQPALKCTPLLANEQEGRKWWGLAYTGGMLHESGRGPVNFTGGLFVPYVDEVSRTFSSEMKTHFVQSLSKPESARILWKFFCAAFQKYDPIEWSKMVALWEKQPENQGKKIEDSFDEVAQGVV